MSKPGFIYGHITLRDRNNKVGVFCFGGGTTNKDYENNMKYYNQAVVDEYLNGFVNRYGNKENGGFKVIKVEVVEHRLPVN